MIIIRMSGGLGNQMFQYALYLKLKQLGRDVTFDDETEYRTVTEDGTFRERRPRMLQAFGIEVPRVRREDLVRMTDSDPSLKCRIRRKLTGRHSAEIHDEDLIFDPAFLERTEGYYCGCFQSPRYFAGAEEAVRRAFAFPQDVHDDPVTEEFASRIAQSGRGSCSIHLRFGDYLQKSGIYGGICTDAYYDRAVEYVRSRCGSVRFYVFSNDAALAGEWIRRRQRPDDFTLITGHDEDHGYLDLYLMTLCTAHILANSSFSFWGAWLFQGSDQLCVAPSMWVHTQDGTELTRCDIYTDDMVRISPSGDIVNRETGQLPAVTVGITACNLEFCIRDAVRSVQRQSLQHLEIIAVDDGSTDRTGQILDELAASDPRIRVLHLDGKGVSAARNAVLEQARGEYTGFLDGDDVVDPEYYELLLRGALAADAAVSMSAYREEEHPVPAEAADLPEDERVRVLFSEYLDRSTVFHGGEALERYVRTAPADSSAPLRIYNSVWSKLFRSDVLKSIRFDNGRLSEDIMFTTRALALAGTSVYVPARLYAYRMGRGGSIMNSRVGERRVRDEIPFWEEQIAFIREQGNPELADLAAYNLTLRLIGYEEEMRGVPETAPYAEEIRNTLQKHRKAIRGIVRARKDAKKSERIRILTFLWSPGCYRCLMKWYLRARNA